MEAGNHHDQHFFDTFLLVMGVLAAIALCAYWIADSIAEATPGAYDKGGAVQEKLIDQRLAPVGEVQISGEAATQMLVAKPVARSGPPKSGKEIWEGTCSACHGTGVLGAPKIGDRAAWGRRLTEGLKTLEQHALHGFKQMPAKGNNPALSDAEVIKALEYMISQSGGAKLIKH
ncbi:MAG TPA: c-type cytochrome [Gammaproteobacteria bacterium]|nr:c-type cytochrome [Gammaproteobacteria bacterium]